ncbi:MAG: hypothetical protein H6558_18680 [Lewinellaceae bacterium]|nr:hypothetical protein [Lewinellaceae bacterium]
MVGCYCFGNLHQPFLRYSRLFRNKTARIGKRKRLRLLDLRFTKEPWED